MVLFWETSVKNVRIFVVAIRYQSGFLNRPSRAINGILLRLNRDQMTLTDRRHDIMTTI